MYVSCTLQVGELVACRGEMEAASGAAAAAAAGAEVQRRRGEAEAGSLMERVAEAEAREAGLKGEVRRLRKELREGGGGGGSAATKAEAETT